MNILCYAPTIHVLVVIAGTNDPSNAATLAAAFTEGMKQHPDMEVETLSLHALDLEHFSLKFYDPKTKQGKDFERVQALIHASDGVVIASPVWNFSVPAHLKNFIDRIGAFALDTETHSQGQLHHKPFFFLYTGGAPVAVWKGITRFTTMHLPESIRYFGGTIVGRHFEGKALIDKATFGLVVDKRPDSLTRVRAKGERFAHFVWNFKNTGKLPLYYRVFNWSYEKGKRLISKF